MSLLSVTAILSRFFFSLPFIVFFRFLFLFGVIKGEFWAFSSSQGKESDAYLVAVKGKDSIGARADIESQASRFLIVGWIFGLDCGRKKRSWILGFILRIFAAVFLLNLSWNGRKGAREEHDALRPAVHRGLAQS